MIGGGLSQAGAALFQPLGSGSTPFSASTGALPSSSPSSARTRACSARPSPRATSPPSAPETAA